MASRSSYERLAAVGMDAVDARLVAAFAVPDGHLHGELDAICPRCLRWIEEHEFVRRTAYGPLQHEVCPSD